MCAICRQVKDLSEFYHYKKINRYNSYCKECETIYQKNYRRAYRENYIAKMKALEEELEQKDKMIKILRNTIRKLRGTGG